MLKVGVLGPLDVSVNGRPVELTAPMMRTLVMAMAMAAGSPVSVDRLAAALWGDGDGPEHVRRAVQTHLTRLRGVLGAELIATEAAGYRLVVDAEQVDALRFGRALDLAARASDVVTERELLDAALALWRGTPLEDVRSGWLVSLRDQLVERYLAAVERRVDLDLAAGHHREVVVVLRDLTASYPLRESLWVRLLTALARSGRQAEALTSYESLRRRLADELGSDPGPEIRRLHAELLATESPQDGSEAASGTSGAAQAAETGQPVIVPRQLPVDIDGFTGRAAALRALHELVDDRNRPTTAVVISAIAGMAGIGKTTLAVHWAHEVADRFPDGQLYVNLRGFHPSGKVVAPAQAVRRFLDGLGVPPSRIPADPDAQLGLYRSLLADRRVLVVLDNARDADQVRPLLPGSSRCLVLVTSRSRLTGLVATEGARPLILDLLPDEEARVLLAARIGHDRIAAEPAATDAIVTRCAGLPLALAVTAARVATSSLSLATVASQLNDERSTLDSLDTGDPAADARVVFSWSYRALTPDATRLFRLLAMHPGPDIGAAAVASLAGATAAEVLPLLAELLGVHLLTEHTAGRYAMHDLLRAYATELTLVHDSDRERRTALHRLLDHYLHTAYVAALLVHPNRDPVITIAPAQPGVTPEALADHDTALAWHAANHAVLPAVVERAAATGFDTHVWQLTWSTTNVLQWRGYWHEWVATHRAALEAAQRLRDRSVEAWARRLLGIAYAQLGRHTAAHPHLQAALDLYQQLDDLLGEAQTRLNLGSSLSMQGRYEDALHHCRRAEELFVAVGNRQHLGMTLNGIGWCYAQLGDYHAAMSYCRRALAVQQELGDRTYEASTWDSLAYAYHRLGDSEQAIYCFQQAIDLHQQLGNRYEEANVLAHLGDAHSAIGQHDTAHAIWRRALTILRELGHPEADQISAKLAAVTAGVTSDHQELVRQNGTVRVD